MPDASAEGRRIGQGSGECSRRAFLAAAGGFLVPRRVAAESSWDELPPPELGDVILTRNPRWNTTPGYWNHVALFHHRGAVIEAHPTFGEVFVSPLSEFTRRYGQVGLLRVRTRGLAPRMVDAAMDLVGKPYAFFPGGEWFNCVRLLRVAYRSASQDDPSWRLPDHLARDDRRLRRVDAGHDAGVANVAGLRSPGGAPRAEPRRSLLGRRIPVYALSAIH